MDHIKGKVIVITGASSGIGHATALLLAQKGAIVVLGARNVDKLEQLASQIKAEGGQAMYAAIDVTQRQHLEKLVALALATYGKLDVLINNAGIAPISLLDELQVEDWDMMIDVNIKGVLYGIAAALPVFRKQGFGHIINTASTAALKVTPAAAVYSGTKFAVRAISEGLRQEAGPNLRVTIITPGIIKTNLVDSIASPGIKAQIAEAMDNIAISPDAIARAMAYAIEQPADVDVSEIVVRPTAQV
ncbi:SDR family oxidoreductase [Mucilaginibacter ginsenosidivorax]|uniref:SDR family oxidoreductase n=1 Tax=Mucilaginibacter ginsenosidivorax TaxID=862126 RepID=A0A5B8W665_9SPHI|nr:SDR family oxidoreductase [Mucilaginibacter ginsenosidivorax]QEC78415.1 SDR family oxidoreductase [Mucilaginibacter ginsenosidivorax]